MNFQYGTEAVTSTSQLNEIGMKKLLWKQSNLHHQYLVQGDGCLHASDKLQINALLINGVSSAWLSTEQTSYR